jgi:hypothetical protein
MLIASPGPRTDALNLDVQLLLPTQVPRRHVLSTPGARALRGRFCVLALCDAGWTFDGRTARRGPVRPGPTYYCASFAMRRAR